MPRVSFVSVVDFCRRLLRLGQGGNFTGCDFRRAVPGCKCGLSSGAAAADATEG